MSKNCVLCTDRVDFQKYTFWDSPMLILIFGLISCIEKPNNALDIDDDGDGFSEFEGDCDDSNPNAYPGAAELDSTELCMVDNDEDGYAEES